MGTEEDRAYDARVDRLRRAEAQRWDEWGDCDPPDPRGKDSQYWIQGCRAFHSEVIETICLFDLDWDDSRPAGWWTSADQQRQIDMRGCTVSGAAADLLAQCATNAEADGILEGTLDILAASTTTNNN